MTLKKLDEKGNEGQTLYDVTCDGCGVMETSSDPNNWDHWSYGEGRHYCGGCMEKANLYEEIRALRAALERVKK